MGKSEEEFRKNREKFRNLQLLVKGQILKSAKPMNGFLRRMREAQSESKDIGNVDENSDSEDVGFLRQKSLPEQKESEVWCILPWFLIGLLLVLLGGLSREAVEMLLADEQAPGSQASSVSPFSSATLDRATKAPAAREPITATPTQPSKKT